VTDVVRTWKHIFNPSDTVAFSESVTDAVRTWKHIFSVSDSTQFSADSVGHWVLTPFEKGEFTAFSEDVTPVTRTWKHIYSLSEDVGFSEEIIAATSLWFHNYDNLSETPVFSEVVTPIITVWKHLFVISEVVAFAESISVSPIKIAASDTVGFVEDVVAEIGLIINARVLPFEDNPTEVFGTSRRTGWIKASENLSRATILRRLNVEYNSADPVDVKIFADGDDVNEIYSYTLAAGVTPETINKSVRIGRRARNFMVEVSTDPSSNANVTIENLGVEVDA
jgi:hypothetical protein